MKLKGRGAFAAMLLVGLNLPCAALARDNENVVAPAPAIAVPDLSSIKIGEPMTIHAKDRLMRFKLIRPPRVRLAAAHSFQVGDLNVAVDADDVLTLSLADRRMSAILGEKDVFFCTERRGNFVAAVLAAWLSRFGKETRVCLLDRDGDRRFETMFLAGAKRAEDRGLRQIEPLAFQMVEDDPADDYHFDVTFWGYPPLGTDSAYDLKLYDKGKRIDGAGFYLNAGRGFIDYGAGPHLKSKKNVPEFPLRIGSAEFTVLSRDREGGNITVRFDRAPAKMYAFFSDPRSNWVPSSVPYYYLRD